MKHSPALLLLVVVATAAAESTDIPGYRLVWNDEFNVDGAPNAASWNFEHGFQRNNEAQWYQEENAFCKDGILVIEARKEKIKNTSFDPNYNGRNAWKKTREFADYSSASLTTSGKREFQYGRIVVRAKIPTASGAWPAIWTLGTSMEWPSCGEIDILEYYRVRGVPHILANYCWGTDQRWKGKWDGFRRPFQEFLDKDPDWASKFHTWRMDWTPEAIRLYLDDELLNDIPTSQAEPTREGGFNPFRNDRPGFGQYILLNLAIGGCGGEVDDTAFPMVYEVDYVRVYQHS